MKPFLLGSRLNIQDIIGVAGHGRPVILPARSRSKIAAAQRQLEKAAASGKPIYGVNTGFGRMASERISPQDVRTLQLNLLRSHACGVGEPLTPEESRAVLLLRANELAAGYSGCRAELVEMLVRLLNQGVAPVIPSRGSVGASGDLAPQAHAALLLIGEGEARIRDGKKWSSPLPGRRVLQRVKLRPLELEAKEGLSLINGTQAMQAVAGLALHRAARVLETAHFAGAMSLEAICGTPAPFDPAVVGLKPHSGQLRVARRLRELLKKSQIRESHRVHDPRVQDPYSFRCIPQVHGAVHDALDYALKVLETEINSVTDNPVVAGGRIISGGNFHGQALSFACDFAAIALTALGNISDRRVAQLISGEHDLPPFLARHPGLESGYMIPQVVTAALASENKIFAHPASADSIPTSAEKEDFVSMGMAAALKLSQIVDHAAQIVAIELLAAARGVEHRRPLKAGVGVERGLALLRSKIFASAGDEILSGKMSTVKELVLGGHFSE